MTKQKQTLCSALEIKVNELLDAHLATTRAQVPAVFRKGLSFKPSSVAPAAGESKPDGKQPTSEDEKEKSKDATAAPDETKDEKSQTDKKTEEQPAENEKREETTPQKPDVRCCLAIIIYVVDCRSRSHSKMSMQLTSS